MSELSEKIHALVSNLPEMYQPIFGFPDLSGSASRATEDRFSSISAVYSALSENVGRPLRVLDLGCAQGFMSFSLAELGASVVGVDLLAENIELCRALADCRQDLDVTFVHSRVEDYIPSLEEGQFDIVMLLSVVHHVAFHSSPEAAVEVIAKVRRCSKVLIAELAVRDEPLYWAQALPLDPVSVFESAKFVRCIRETETHLSEVKRPTYFVSDDYWYACGAVDRFSELKRGGHRFAKDSFKSSRSYYFSECSLLKVFSLDGEDSGMNSAEIGREADFLRNNMGGVYPRLIGVEDCGSSALLVRDKIPGRLLMDVIDSGESFDYYLVIRDVLRECVELEAQGLYHQDVRVWNILQCEDGSFRLIDFGAISDEKRDCFWPQNIYISFIIFVKELISAPHIVTSPIREVAVSPYGFPGHLSAWVARLSSVPLTEWTFERMAFELDQAFLTPGSSASEPVTSQDALLKMLEESVTVLARFLNDFRSESEDNEIEFMAAVEVERGRVSNLHNDLLKTGGQIEGLAERASLTEVALFRLEEVASAQADVAAGLSQRIDVSDALFKGFENKIQEFSEGIDAVRGGASAILGGVEALNGRVSSLDGSLASTASEVGDRLDAILHGQREFSNLCSDLKSQLELHVVDDIRKVADAKVAQLESKLESLDLKIESLIRIVELEMGALRSNDSIVMSQIDNIAGRVLRKSFWARIFGR